MWSKFYDNTFCSPKDLERVPLSCIEKNPVRTLKLLLNSTFLLDIDQSYLNGVKLYPTTLLLGGRNQCPVKNNNFCSSILQESFRTIPKALTESYVDALMTLLLCILF